MIKSITMKNIGSYKETKLETDKRINLIFGFNGTGKTLLSKNIKIDNEYIEWDEKNIDEIITFNTDYILKNFYEVKEKFEPVFYMGQNPNIIEKNDTIKNKINNITEEIRQLEYNTNNEVNKSSLIIMKKNHQEKLEKLIWNIKVELEKKDIGTILLKDMNKKGKSLFLKSFLDKKIIQHNDVTSSDIYTKLYTLKKDTGITPTLEYLNLDNIKKIISNDIFNKIIVGNKNSKISEYIEKLNNAEWVKQGYTAYIEKDNNICPFCQKETITNEFINSLKEYFDISYNNDINLLNKLLNNFDDELNLLNKNNYIDNKYIQAEIKIFDEKYYSLINKLNIISRQIREKILKPNIEINLENIDNELDQLNNFINYINKKIDNDNNEINNQEATKTYLVNIFWSIKKTELQQYINDINNEIKQLDKQIIVCNNKIIEKNKELTTLKKEYEENLTKFKNVEEAKKNINNQLKNMGFDYFYIDNYIDETIINSPEEDKHIYKLVRKDQNNNQDFHSFSEGEKMIISFLYFIEKCKSAAKIKNIIVVIDDPISSISNNNLFEIAFIIRKLTELKNQQTELFKQFFILTHNIYFFDELKRTINHDASKLFQIYRTDKGSIIGSLNEKNLYKYLAFWQTYKEITIKKNINQILLPNTMRNILEFFYSIILKDDFNKLKNDSKYSSLYRFVNKETHFFTDEYETLPVDKYIALFEQLFKDKNYAHHFKAMIKE